MVNKNKSNKTKKQSQFTPLSDIKLLSNFNNVRLEVWKNVDKGQIATSTTVATLGSYDFKLSELYEVSSYTSVFDQYRIVSVELIIIPVNQKPLATTSNVSAPCLFMAYDLDDSGTPASINIIYNYENMLTLECGHSKIVRFKPAISLAAYSTAFDSNATKQDQWIDCANTGVTHYGFKYAANANATIAVWQVVAKYCLQFKNIR